MLEALKQPLIEALEDEYKARATYQLILQKFGAIRPFINILESEKRHIQALLPLFWKYGIPVPEDDWEHRVTVPASVQDACAAGVQAEIENAAMYQRLLAMTRAFPDVQRVFLNLQHASQNNHLTAFQRCVDRTSGYGLAPHPSSRQSPGCHPGRYGGGRRGHGRGCRQRVG